MNPPQQLERVSAGDLHADIAPQVGGALAAFFSAAEGAPAQHWLRPASAQALAARQPLGMASFPLVPWCNRIRDGRFEWNGRQVALAPNYEDSPHTLHGIGWQRPWQVVGRGPQVLELALEVDGRGEWPFPFEARQRYQLDAAGLSITVAVRNTGGETMPAGIGHHPYLPNLRQGEGTQVQAEVRAMWLGDAQAMPLALDPAHPAVRALRAGLRLNAFDLDNNFSGFGRSAVARWPDGSGLQMDAEPPFDFFVLYCPQDKPFFCMEPVSNCTDWPNLRGRYGRDDLGGTALAPGETLHGTLRLRPLPAARRALQAAPGPDA